MMADYKLGVSFLKREDESLKDYLVSFSPFAPFFGVPYRFAPAMTFDAFAFAPATAEPAPAPKAKPAARKAKKTVVEDAVEAAAEAAEAVPAPEPAAEPAAEPTPEPSGDGAPALLYASAPATADDLKQIRGIGPKLERELNGMGLYTFAQMASLTAANLEWVDQNLTAFRGRSVRDDWVGQASALLGS
ncbi:Predicted 5' DNA nuclease, flap endonuclease-1-like, helix-3-turn-helix (H3TH) domain [Albimonas pacifica]|uniref:Predicted 5' DNA nuclease, flap endonuclease-1-like, helix-3-turn-helix (H3TH) domain n=2 Tax=Albimonas pacifica TaxID=1114924 RepID=A0A1I3PKI6_9RHOB|nr:Predicted 5' DNA nuclease, flap endonuclease-1-like, helix-3-turn-helix (H3TH) domain [Albimonas pacifica]